MLKSRWGIRLELINMLNEAPSSSPRIYNEILLCDNKTSMIHHGDTERLLSVPKEVLTSTRQTCMAALQSFSLPRMTTHRLCCHWCRSAAPTPAQPTTGASLWSGFMSQNGHTETVRVLAACVVDTRKANNNGETPFWVSAVHGHTETVPVLKACGTDASAARMYPCLCCCQVPHVCYTSHHDCSTSLLARSVLLTASSIDHLTSRMMTSNFC